jgi:acyl-coenzyme A synthetase/AMP-(fatty) acid ligase
VSGDRIFARPRADPDLFARLRAHSPAAPALVDAHGIVDYRTLLAGVERTAADLVARGVRVLATQLDNGVAWAMADLAALHAGIVHVPLPGFFSPGQRQHVLRAAGVDALLVPAAGSAASTSGASREGGAALRVGSETLQLVRLEAPAAATPHGTAKITFTSGTTGTPKGVCLSAQGLADVAFSVAEALAPIGIARHLCALPLPLLLENVAGLYAPLAAGASVVLLPGPAVGLTGSSVFDPAVLDAAIEHHRADSVITLPQMLRLWTGWRAARGAQPSRLAFVAVGGAPAGATLIGQARAQGLPAYEGYGLSECGSVQTLNLPHADSPGSVGRPLPHARVRIGAGGEIEVSGTPMLGYLGAAPGAPPWWPTGDLGSIDAAGFLSVRGRTRHVLITAFGRNVSPEWVETHLASQPAVAQAAVFGDGEPALSAVLWPARADLPDTALAQGVRAANAVLPDYARVSRWIRASAPFSAASGMATANGRPRRDAILHHHAAALAAAHTRQSMPFFDRLVTATADDRQQLVSAPIIQATLRGEIELPGYLAFLHEAYHHVRHTVPLLQACRARVPDRLAWLRPALEEYVAEEAGHDAWILDDIGAAGGNREAARSGRPGFATEVMVAYAYDTIARGNPVGFLGMVHVLEGTSVALALTAADRIQQRLGLPDHAFTYLRSHGTLDREHTAQFALLVNALDDPQDQDAVIHGARVFYRLYGDVFRSLPLPQAALRHERLAAAA